MIRELKIIFCICACVKTTFSASSSPSKEKKKEKKQDLSLDRKWLESTLNRNRRVLCDPVLFRPLRWYFLRCKVTTNLGLPFGILIPTDHCARLLCLFLFCEDGCLFKLKDFKHSRHLRLCNYTLLKTLSADPFNQQKNFARTIWRGKEKSVRKKEGFSRHPQYSRPLSSSLNRKHSHLSYHNIWIMTTLCTRHDGFNFPTRWHFDIMF